MLACWISSLLQNFDGSNVKDKLTSLVATTSTEMPKSSKVENTYLDDESHRRGDITTITIRNSKTRKAIWQQLQKQNQGNKEFLTFARKPTWPSMRVLTISNRVTFCFRTMLVRTAWSWFQGIDWGKNKRSRMFEFYTLQFSRKQEKKREDKADQTLLISLVLVMRVPGALGL